VKRELLPCLGFAGQQLYRRVAERPGDILRVTRRLFVVSAESLETLPMGFLIEICLELSMLEFVCEV